MAYEIDKETMDELMIKGYEPSEKELNFAKYFGILIDSVVEENLPHTVSEVICVKCGKRWIACIPDYLKLKELECPNCGAGYVIETGQTWTEEEMYG